MRLHTAIPVLLVLTTFLCACQKTSSQNETDSKAELVTSTASTTSIATAASTSTDSTSTEPMDPIVQSEFKLVQPQLSTVFPSLQEDLIRDFQYDAFVPLKDQQYDSLSPFFLKDNLLYLQKGICNFSNSNDIVFYKYDLNTGKSTDIEGRLEQRQYGPHEGDCAYAGDRIYASFGSETQEAVHYALDTEQDSVEVIKKEPTDEVTSFCATFPVNEKEYVETYMTNNRDHVNGLRYTYYVTLFGETGEREIVTHEYGWDENYRYTVNDNKLYEYSQSENGDDPRLRIYDLNGNLLESYELPEVSSLLKDRGNLEEDMENRTIGISAFGDYCLVTVDICFSGHNKCVLYNLKDKTACMLENCFYQSPNISVDSTVKNHILALYYDQTDSYGVYNLNNAGLFTPVLELPPFDGYVVTDGTSLVYLNKAEKKLYRIGL
ncbi:hypothetical protein [Ruminococcus champanellensis]|uniref:hypothetical protein n=1 Tax=Ruminococcus champanellensis TaxID=1161942 RepID=UPI00248CB926|nr:hypothetical protein [Ruminococcus champanellensis]